MLIRLRNREKEEEEEEEKDKEAVAEAGCRFTSVTSHKLWPSKSMRHVAT